MQLGRSHGSGLSLAHGCDLPCARQVALLQALGSAWNAKQSKRKQSNAMHSNAFTMLFEKKKKRKYLIGVAPGSFYPV